MNKKLFKPLDWESKTGKKIRVVEDGFFERANHHHLYHKLTKDGIVFFQYLCQQMRDDNSIYIDVNFKNQYIDYLTKIVGKDAAVTINTLNKYVQQLKKLQLIIPKEKRAFYTVNPKYVRRGSKKHSIKIWKSLISKRSNANQSLKGLLDFPEEKFLKSC
jgi:hypothetical protein